MILSNAIGNDENLYRAVNTTDYEISFDTENNRFAVAYYKAHSTKNNPFSVDRSGGRNTGDVITGFKRFSNSIGVIELACWACRKIPTYLHYKPTKNTYHSEIWDSELEKEIDQSKCRNLALIGRFIKG